MLYICPVGWSCRIHPTASLQRGKTPPNEYLGYGLKQSDGEAPVLELWGMWHTPLLPLLPGWLWTGVLAPDRVLSIGQMELECKQMTYAKLNC